MSEPRRPLLLAALVGVGLQVALAAPSWLLAGSADSGETWSGAAVHAADQLQYQAWIQESAAGAWLLADRYAAEPHTDVLISPTFVALGKVAALTGWSPAVVVRVVAPLAGLALFFALYGLMGLFLRGGARLTATALAFVAGGLDRVLLALGVEDLPPGSADLPDAVPAFPVSSSMVELHVADCVAWFPHLSIALLLLILALAGWVRWLRDGGRGPAALALCSALLLGFTHPFDVVVLGGWAAALLLVHRERLGRGAAGLALLLAASAPGPLVVGAGLRSSEVWAAVLEANLQPSPPPLWLALGMGIPLLATLAGLPALRRLETDARRALLAGAGMAAATWLMVWLPFDLQRRLAFGVTVPLALATVAAWGPLLRARWRVPAGLAVLALAGWGSALTCADAVGAAIDVPAWDRVRSWVPAELEEAIDAAERALPEGVVLSDPMVGGVVPARSAGLRVVAGHWGHTPDHAGRVELWRGFIAPGATPSQRLEILCASGAELVLLPVQPGDGPQADHRRDWANLRRVADQLDAAGLERVFSGRRYRVYRLSEPCSRR